ncbi:serine threonine protein kinase : Probable serine/threonine-protein kinase pknB OS=Planctomyces maris DSM 8797 GN=PM8797T_26140 PE=3 SV=1: Pkinase: FGE-sulfatase [Gemmata massiliana]|uniref:Protein kinase domain-containing protein n=1 Tax=Gemmata massiliana TaxID=1210884 RepID=A0A6P2D1I8_9BACT|nr:bifunctional serine/threonine-protein kinase/formylglycine-generating enzyme family protein [Gemmata massiliana]VTR93974.1 serine threonine protein kinase : Probable serine/threonine-protein kinase pknB OS=Planctomyces maris DSM 8797 GN=PM8797T_26140 PE=3 SV=1: Pkinase: FGE-sulfatase [Gemmata massiliana]
MSSAADATATFYQHLQASRLLTEDQLRELWGWIAYTKPDVQGVAKELHRRSWLTPYQIREIAKGRAATLKIASRYVLLDILGEGGMGRVYRVQDARMGRTVALKVIRKEKLGQGLVQGRFYQEIQALSAMDHPNVVKVYDAEEVGGNHFYVMELIDGTDLTKIVRDRGALSVPEACDVIRQAALGLEHAFERGLVHRDIKPSNIIVPRTGGTVKLVDLGLARLMEQPGGEDAHRITQEGFVIGTPDFLAPEQARNPMAVDIRADIYALGGTLYYALTGKAPFDGLTPTEKLLKHCTEPPPRLLLSRPDAPPQLEQIILWCMAKPPEERPQTPLQLALALQPFCPAPAPGGSLPGSGYYTVPTVAPVPAHLGAYVTPQPHTISYPPQPAYQPPPGYPAPVYTPQTIPLPPPEPAPSNQVFKLPPRSNADDPIRRRAEGGFPVGPVLVVLGALFVVGVLGFAGYQLFLKPEPPPLEPFTNTVEMKMVRIEGGTFQMGSPDTEPGRPADGREGPVREVAIRGPFFMSATEVTNTQFARVMGRHESKSAKIAHRTESLPADSVTWSEANDFCQKLTGLEKEKPWARKNWAYRLPTEAEWEYTARAGTDSPFAFGEKVTFSTQAVFRAIEEDPLGTGGDPLKLIRFPQEVGKTEPNKFGLYDMHGNVAEWCGDWYRPDAYKDAARDNPTGPTDGDKRVVRGGSFRDPAAATRSAARDGQRQPARLDFVGFRVVYAPVQK